MDCSQWKILLEAIARTPSAIAVPVVTGREVYLGSQGTYSHETVFHPIFQSTRLGSAGEYHRGFNR